jgi:hypothetical protein
MTAQSASMVTPTQNLPTQPVPIPGYKLDENGVPCIELYASEKKLRKLKLNIIGFRIMCWTTVILIPLIVVGIVLTGLVPFYSSATFAMYAHRHPAAAHAEMMHSFRSLVPVAWLLLGIAVCQIAHHYWLINFMEGSLPRLSSGQPVLIISEGGVSSAYVYRPDRYVAWDDIAEFNRGKGGRPYVVARLKYEAEGFWPTLKARFFRSI